MFVGFGKGWGREGCVEVGGGGGGGGGGGRRGGGGGGGRWRGLRWGGRGGGVGGGKGCWGWGREGCGSIERVILTN